jgi:hypothetical protein
MQISGSVDVPFGDKTYQVRTDFALIERIESRINILNSVRKMAIGDIRISDVAWVIYSALDGKKDYQEVGNEVRVNLQKYGQVVADIYEGCLASPGIAEDQKETAKKKPRSSKG